MVFQSPRHIADVLTELMTRYGYARQQFSAALEEAWNQAVGPMLAPTTRPGRIRRGVLEVVVAHSAMVQELTFQKETLLSTLNRLLPDQPIQDLRFRLGRIS